MTYNILENTEEGLALYGGALKVWLSKAHEIILSGAAETGKTRACLEKLNALCWKYSNLQAVIVRKTYNSALSSCIETFDNKVIAHLLVDNIIDKYGGERVQFYLYPNGSRIWVAGLDKSAKVLSSERDIIYVNQAEEFLEEEWEMLLSRATGRAGNSPYPQILGDCNPSHPRHWILHRKSLELFYSAHEDNPTLFDPDTGQQTEQGKRTLTILDNLTGVRKERYRHGRWVEAEGAIYGALYNPSVHLIDSFDIPSSWRRVRAIDFGLSNPFVCLWIAEDEDGRLYVYRQIYMTGKTVASHSKIILEAERKHTELRQKENEEFREKIYETVCDHDAEDRLTLRENGIPNSKANKAVIRGIEAVQERLKLQKDNKPRLYIFKDSLIETDKELELLKKPLELAHEFPEYAWKDKAAKETPVKDNDHALDALRYGIMFFDGEYTGRVMDISHNPFYD